MNTLLATSTHNTKATEIENKIADTSNLVRKTYCNTKIKQMKDKTPDHDRYITTLEFHNFFFLKHLFSKI